MVTRADDHHQDGDHHRHDGTADEELGHGSYFPAVSAVAAYGFGVTVMPARTFCTPSATTRSPGFNPSSMIHWLPTRSLGFTFRMLILLSLSTTATW